MPETTMVTEFTTQFLHHFTQSKKHWNFIDTGKVNFNLKESRKVKSEEIQMFGS